MRQALLAMRDYLAEESQGRVRQTGRTTRMLTEAVVAASLGESVLIVAADERHARNLMNSLYRLDPPPSRDGRPLLRVCSIQQLSALHGMTANVVKIDHFAVAQTLSAALHPFQTLLALGWLMPEPDPVPECRVLARVER